MLCITCGFEPRDIQTAEPEHLAFDPAHAPTWVSEGPDGTAVAHSDEAAQVLDMIEALAAIPIAETTATACRLCSWGETWSTRDAALAAATWHVFDDHPIDWTMIHGMRVPEVPLPVVVGERVAP